MNKKSSHLIFGIAVVVFVAAIGFFIYQQEAIIQSGETVILETRPVDPRDLFRGEYVILRYAIETDEAIQSVADGLPSDAPLYIELERDEEGVASVKRVQENAPDSFDGLWIKGDVSGRTVRFPSLEQFYVPEGSGLAIESFGAALHVEVALHNGDARVVRLLDGSLNEIDPADYLEEF